MDLCVCVCVCVCRVRSCTFTPSLLAISKAELTDMLKADIVEMSLDMNQEEIDILIDATMKQVSAGADTISMCSNYPGLTHTTAPIMAPMVDECLSHRSSSRSSNGSKVGPILNNKQSTYF